MHNPSNEEGKNSTARLSCMSIAHCLHAGPAALPPLMLEISRIDAEPFAHPICTTLDSDGEGRSF
jgi:hypothetical protein